MCIWKVMNVTRAWLSYSQEFHWYIKHHVEFQNVYTVFIQEIDLLEKVYQEKRRGENLISSIIIRIAGFPLSLDFVLGVLTKNWGLFCIFEIICRAYCIVQLYKQKLVALKISFLLLVEQSTYKPGGNLQKKVKRKMV